MYGKLPKLVDNFLKLIQRISPILVILKDKV